MTPSQINEWLEILQRAPTHGGILLNLNKTTDARLIPYRTAVKVSETEYLDGPSQRNIGSNAVKRFHAVLMMFRRPFLLLAAAT